MDVFLRTQTAVAKVRFLPPCFPQKNDAVMFTKPDSEMFHDESRKSIHFGGNRSGVKVTSHKTGVGLCTLVSAGLFYE